MADILKTFAIALDTKSASYGDRILLTESDTGNRFVITLTDDGVAVDLSAARVAVVFSGPMGTAMQDSWTGTGDVAISGASHNIITVDVHNGAYADGLNTCEVQVYSGTSYETLITSAQFTFNARKPIVDDTTIAADEAYPTLVYWQGKYQEMLDREQSNYTETDTEVGSYIRNKPVAGTDFCDAIPNLTAETTLATTDTIPFYDASATAHRKTTFLNLIQKIFGSITGLVKADGAGNISAAVANTDYAAAAHASRHASGAADAVTPAAIGAEKEHLEFLDQAVSTSGWATYTPSGTEETAINNTLLYTYRKTITLSGVTTGYTGTVSPRAAYESCGTQIYRRCQTLTDGIYLYAKATPTGAFTIDVFIRKGVG